MSVRHNALIEFSEKKMEIFTLHLIQMLPQANFSHIISIRCRTISFDLIQLLWIRWIIICLACLFALYFWCFTHFQCVVQWCYMTHKCTRTLYISLRRHLIRSKSINRLKCVFFLYMNMAKVVPCILRGICMCMPACYSEGFPFSDTCVLQNKIENVYSF